MSQPSASIWETLLAAKLVQGERPERDTNSSPWYIKLLLAFSGWLAALFLLGFIGIGFQFIFNNHIAALILGSIMIGGAFTALRIPKNEFAEHLALAASLTGQVLVIFAISEFTAHNEGGIWLFVSVLQILLAIVMPSYIHRVFSSWVGAFAFATALAILGAGYIGSSIVMFFAVWFWLNEFKYPAHLQKTRAIGYGLVLALIQLKSTAIFDLHGISWQAYQQSELWIEPWVNEIFIAVITLYLLRELLKQQQIKLSEPRAISLLLATLLVSVASFEAQGITIGMVVIILGFTAANRLLIGIGIISLLFYISTYYYLLDTTLLNKSLSLLIIGSVFLVIRYLMHRFFPLKKEQSHA